MIVQTSPSGARAIVAAMRRVGTIGGVVPLTAVDRLTIAARDEALGALAETTFGRAFWAHYRKNGYPFPGVPGALASAFATPHDSTHVLSGYSTANTSTVQPGARRTRSWRD